MRAKRRDRLLVASIPLFLGLTGWAWGEPVHERAIGGRIVDGSSGNAVVGAVVSVAATDRGSLTDPEGRFLVSGVPDSGAMEVVIRHPCFHLVRVDVDDPGDAVLEVGLPFRERSTEDGWLGRCPGYGPSR